MLVRQSAQRGRGFLQPGQHVICKYTSLIALIERQIYRILHELSFNVNIYETSLGNGYIKINETS